MGEPVAVRWKDEGLRFEGVTPNGRVDLASGLEPEGSGIRPMELLAVALGGCTAMDVLSILQKMRQPVEAFSVEVSGERAEEHPRRYTSLEVVYRLRGDLDEAKVARAIELSETRYCSVEATLRPAVPITSRFEIVR
ncbi:MAG TPA: OsmC family protein [Thermoleophilia bacterium]|nr:OsmC family protein [Thermoleophilia bacterium]HQG03145.1 OsmC family protein [Thermoleophilia bacterium]HQG54889.1 OsmC family protein [Thermoleophilia bacterium]HQJ97827.1 OsmC family protein [Thermoleophilia bacterium]